jgi:hypothetical protein
MEAIKERAKAGRMRGRLSHIALPLVLAALALVNGQAGAESLCPLPPKEIGMTKLKAPKTDPLERAIPPIDNRRTVRTETATFAMG